MLGPRKLSRWLEDHPFRVDLALTLALMVPVLVIGSGLSSATVAVSLLMLAPLPWRRTRPVISAVLVHSFALSHWIMGTDWLVQTDFSVLISIYSVAGHGPVLASRLALVSGIIGSGLLSLSAYHLTGSHLGSALAFGFTAAALVIASWAMGTMRAARRERWAALANRAAELERGYEQQRSLAIAAERARIAREMHDIVAHSLSIMVAQADGGQYAAQHKPEVAAQALNTIAETGRAALADMRKILGILRSESAQDSVPAPQPSLAEIERLIEESKAAGMRISFAQIGRPAPLPAGAEMVLYRVCQESLTNVRKHAGPDPVVTVALSWEPASVRLIIQDDGRGAAAVSDTVGHGLLGIRERAGILGAIVTMGPRRGGGFQVDFELPLPGNQSFSEEEIRWQTPT